MVKVSHRINKPLWDFQVEGLIPPKLEKIVFFFLVAVNIFKLNVEIINENIDLIKDINFTSKQITLLL